MDGWNGLSGCGCGKWKVDVESGKWKVESGAVPDLTTVSIRQIGTTASRALLFKARIFQLCSFHYHEYKQFKH